MGGAAPLCFCARGGPVTVELSKDLVGAPEGSLGLFGHDLELCFEHGPRRFDLPPG